MNNISNEKLSEAQINKFASLVDEIEGIKNTIPLSTKSVFNFKGRKCSDIAEIIIKALTNENSYVWDPFMGSGTYPIASASIPCKTLATELDNYTYSIVQSLIEPIDFVKVNTMFDELKNDVFDNVMSLYETECCGHKNFIKTLHFDPKPSEDLNHKSPEYFNPKSHRDIKDGKNIKLYYTCPVCNNKDKAFSSIDEDKIKYCEGLDTTKFPSHTLIENSRINITASTNADKYDTNFSNRNKYALLQIQNRINQFDDCSERDILEHALVSSLTLSRIAQYGSGSEYIYQVLKLQAQDMNVWYLFESKFKNIISYKQSLLKKENADFSPNNLTILNTDYSSLLNNIEYKGSFDLIYTDPPYTDQVPYLERNQLYRDWLKEFYSSSKNNFDLTIDMLDKEVVVSNAPTRSHQKSMDNYFKDLDKMFEVFNYCLKTDGVVALTLNLGKAKYFKVLSEFINKARKNGFEYVLRIDLDKPDLSLRKQAAFKNTLSKEMIVFFVKLPEDKSYWYIDDKNIEFEIIKYVYNFISNSVDTISISKLVQLVNDNVLMTSYNRNNSINEKIKSIIKNNFVINTHNAAVSIDIDKLYLSIEDNTSLFNKIYNIVPSIINNLLNTKKQFTLDDLYFDLSNRICSGDPNTLEQIITDTTLDNTIKNILSNYCDLTNKDIYVSKNINNLCNDEAIDISVLDGYDFEKLLHDLLIAEGYTNVLLEGRSGDKGVDLIAQKLNPLTNKLETYIFQAKRWVANVGSTPIQRLHSRKCQFSNEIDHAICITTSDYTKDGKDVAKGTGVITVNGKEILDRLNNAFPGKYKHTLLNFNI